MNRREFLRSLIATSALFGVYVAGLEELTNIGRASNSSQSFVPQYISQNSTTQQQQNQQVTNSIPSGYTYIAQLSAFNGLTYAYFTHPNFGQSLFVKLYSTWKAFSATCTHQPCTVNYQRSSINCPCHGGSFNPSNGMVTGGPPQSPLPEYGVLIQNGNVYVTLSRIN